MTTSIVRQLLRFGRSGREVLRPKAAYELWADTYPPWAHNPLMRAEQSAMEPILASLTASSALDMGTGSGRYLPLLARTGARTVLGLDLSLAMLARATRDVPRVCADVCRLPFRGAAFDLVVAALMAGDVEDLAQWMREIFRTLLPGGHLLYSDFHPFWTGQNWTRTFDAMDGRRISVPYVKRSIDQHLACLAGVGLQVQAIREPRLHDESDPAVEAFRKHWGSPPVVVVFHAVKPGVLRRPRGRSGLARAGLASETA